MRINMPSFACLLSLLISSFILCSCQVVELPLGTVNGLECPMDTPAIQYLGIPFALSPVGSLRFRPPIPYNITYPAEGFDATTYPHRCGTPCDGMMIDNERVTVGEDCLFMNIWVPSAKSESLLPVRVYIHGGMNKACNANDAHISGCNAASFSSSIVINIQYRLGAPGFLAHPLTLLESNTTGNWGILDQQLAMKWIKNHVQYFGGDPEKILLHGGSSGGTNVAIQTTLLSNTGLFSKAVIQSATCLTMLTIEEGYSLASNFSAATGCNSSDAAVELACLRNLTLPDMVAATDNYTGSNCFTKTDLAFNPVMDNRIIEKQVMEAYTSNQVVDVPIMFGVNEKEGSFFINMYLIDKWSITEETMEEIIIELFPLVEPHYVLDLYPAINYATKPNPNYDRMVDILTDVNIACSAFSMMYARYRFNATTFAYFFKHSPTCPMDSYYMGATHGSELTFVFGNTINVTPPNGDCNFTQAENSLADEFMHAWTAFADSGVPSFINGTKFALWDLVNMTTTILDVESVSHTVDVTNRCVAINKFHQGVTDLPDSIMGVEKRKRKNIFSS